MGLGHLRCLELVALALGALLACSSSASKQPAAGDDAAPPVAVTPPADAAPAPVSRRERPEKSKAYSAALARGRKLGDRRDYKAAVAAFEEALVALPGDARALSELGWVAFKAGDLARAADATEKSIAAASEPRLRAASLYNRGRIAEQRGDNDRAIAAYQESLTLRPHQVVAQRLAKLSGKVAEALALAPMTGPYPTLAELCKALPFYEPQWTCGSPHVEGATAVADVAAPYTAVRIIGEAPDGLPADESWDTCHLAVQTARGWWRGPSLACERYKWASAKVVELAVGPADAGGNPTLVWTHESGTGDRGFDRDGNRYMTWSYDTRRVYCGIGASGQPSCTPWLVLGAREQGDYAYATGADYQLSAALEAGGALTIARLSGKPDAAAKLLIGARTLAFP